MGKLVVQDKQYGMQASDMADRQGKAVKKYSQESGARKLGGDTRGSWVESVPNGG